MSQPTLAPISLGTAAALAGCDGEVSSTDASTAGLPHVVSTGATSLVLVLDALTSADNDARRRAEQTYKDLGQKCPLKVVCELLQVCSDLAHDVASGSCMASCLERELAGTQDRT